MPRDRRSDSSPRPDPGSTVARMAERVHVVRDAVMVYRQSPGVPQDELEATRLLLAIARAAIPVETTPVPEVWAGVDTERSLAITLRVLRWQWHAIVLGVACVYLDEPRIGDAVPVAAVVAEHQRRRGGISEERARAELRAAAWDARPVDVEVQPEQWRMRSRLTMDDWTLRVQRTGDGPPLIISATWRSDSRRV